MGLEPGGSFFIQGVKVTKTRGFMSFNVACKWKRKGIQKYIARLKEHRQTERRHSNLKWDPINPSVKISPEFGKNVNNKNKFYP